MRILYIMISVSSIFSDDCALWARSGECKKNPNYMFSQCSEECDMLGIKNEEYSEKCTRINDTEALLPFTLNKLFLSIPNDFKYLTPEIVSDEPPIIVFDNFASDEECDAFIKYAYGKYTRSTGLKVEDFKITSIETPIRTSLNTWCQTPQCMDNVHIKNVTSRVSEVTKIPEVNFEYAQLLYYFACVDENSDNCSFYRKHHDFIPEQFNMNSGVRVMTCFIYLNDVDEGGFTVFGTGISVQPKKGRAVLWSNVKDDAPHDMDTRTYHEARPVLKGEKMAANFWIHQYDFKTPHMKGC